METEPTRVLFLLSDTAGGHRAVASAMADSLISRCGNAVECETLDIFVSAGLPVLRHAGSIYQLLASRYEWVYNAGYALTNSRLFTNVASRLLFRLWKERLRTLLVSMNADLAVVDHPFLVSSLIDLARREFQPDLRVVTVVTDLVSLHASWAWPSVDRCLVPTDEAYRRMRDLGMHSSKLRYVKFPVHSNFTQLGLNKIGARRLLGIREDMFTILVTGGGDGLGQHIKVIDAISRALPDAQILAVAGNNHRLYDNLERMKRPHMRAYGYSDQMPDLMQACDVIVGKAGPSTIMEASVVGRPIIVIAEVGRQERGNARLVEREGWGIWCRSAEQVVSALRLLSDLSISRELGVRNKVASLNRNQADDAASLLLAELGLASDTS